MPAFGKQPLRQKITFIKCHTPNRNIKRKIPTNFSNLIRSLSLVFLKRESIRLLFNFYKVRKVHYQVIVDFFLSDDV